MQANGREERVSDEATRRADGDADVTRLRRAAGDGLEYAADAMHRAGRKVAHRGGPVARTSSAAHRLGTELDHAASFVRSREMDRWRAEVETSISHHPVRSVTIALVAGYILGRTLGR